MHDLSTFDPTIETLSALVAESADIVNVTPDDTTQLKLVKSARIKLRDARVAIEKTGKKYREEALAYQRAVLQKEKSLIAIIEPEENRLKDIEKGVEAEKERRLRIQQLPERRKRLEDNDLPIDESILLEVDSVAFENHFNQLVAEKNQKDREKAEAEAAQKAAELKAREDAIRAEEERIASEERTRQREETARQQERERIEREALQKEEQEKRDAEARKREERYQSFLKEHGWTPETSDHFKEERLGTEVILWKKVASFKLSQSESR